MERRLKWYFAANLSALKYAFDQIQVAVVSARLNTILKPYCLIDDCSDLSEVADAIAWLEHSGVVVILHQAELYKTVRRHFGIGSQVFSGHWLRCDIPVIETQDDIVLYTDIDVIFEKNVDIDDFIPETVACAPEHRQDDFSYFNSGIMVMNLPALRDTRNMLIDVLYQRLGSMQPHDDQSVFNIVYKESWIRLPNVYNWKPYWGHIENASVVHFHGPKPDVIRRMLDGQDESFPVEYWEMFRRSPEGYSKYLADFDKFLSKSLPPLSSKDLDLEIGDSDVARTQILVGTWLEISDGQRLHLFVDGWSQSEPWGIWGISSSHCLAIVPADPSLITFDADFDVHVPLGPGRQEQFVDVFVNGHLQALWEFSFENNRLIRTISLTRAGDKRSISVEIRPRTVLRACDVDPITTDTRTLGVALHRLRIRKCRAASD